MPKIYLEIEIDVSGTITGGMASTYNYEGHPDYCDDVEVDDVSFEVDGVPYDLLEGLSKEARDRVCLNLTDKLMERMVEAIFEDA